MILSNSDNNHIVDSLMPRSDVDMMHRQLRADSVANLTISSNLISQSHDRSLQFADIQLERTTYKIPHVLEQNLLDLPIAPMLEGGSKGLPIFWHVLKSGGTTIKLMYAQCYHLVEACETGVLIDAEQKQQFPPPDEGNTQLGNQMRIVTEEDGRRYVNVDVTTPEGIKKASQLGFSSSNLADVIFTPLLTESAQSLLDGDTHKGRMFALFRHPVERLVSIFYYLQGATWEPTYNPIYAQWTIDDYAQSEYCESNWMVRALLDKMTGPLSGEDIMVAKEVLRRKCIVGLMHRMEDSIVRFHSYFGFGDDNALQCSKDNFVRKGTAQNTHKHPKLDQNSATWEILEKKNGLDLMLFEHAQQLFEEQGKWLS